MSRLRSFITLVCLFIHSFAMPLADDDDDGDDGDCESEPILSSHPVVHVEALPTTTHTIQPPPTPHPSPSQHPHASLPVSHRSQTPAILGAVIVLALVAFALTARYLVRRRRVTGDPFKDPPKSKFTAFRLRSSTAAKKRLSDESWVSPALGSPESQDLESGRPQRKLVPVTTPVCTPTDTEFGSRLDSDSVIPVPPVRVPSPVYFSPFSPSPSITSSSSLSPTPSSEPLGTPTPNPARLSRLLSSTFRPTRVAVSPARPTTAHLIHTARSYAHAYHPSSATTTSLYTPPTSRLSGTRSRTTFYPGPTDDARAGWARVRDTFSTVTTTDTVCAVPHLLDAIAEDQPSTSPFADPDPSTPMGTPLGLKLRLSDASNHAKYRLRERERERERQHKMEREGEEQQQCADAQTCASIVHQESRDFEVEVRKQFRLRDSESVLREIGW